MTTVVSDIPIPSKIAHLLADPEVARWIRDFRSEQRAQAWDEGAWATADRWDTAPARHSPCPTQPVPTGGHEVSIEKILYDHRIIHDRYSPLCACGDWRVSTGTTPGRAQRIAGTACHILDEHPHLLVRRTVTVSDWEDVL